MAWPDYDPARTRLDEVAARAALRAALSSPVPASWDGLEIVDTALAQATGGWTSGWRWSASEGDPGGGPVDASVWCCLAHSFFPGGWRRSAVDTQVEQILAAVHAWRDALERAAALFQELGRDLEDTQSRAALEIAVGRIVDQALADTGANDAWYNWARQLLAWFFETPGVDADAANSLAQRMVGGRFRSWVAPDPDSRTGGFDAIADELSDAMLLRG